MAKTSALAPRLAIYQSTLLFLRAKIQIQFVGGQVAYTRAKLLCIRAAQKCEQPFSGPSCLFMVRHGGCEAALLIFCPALFRPPRRSR
jgi:hypothetical protein